jgi:hypothetical protein
LAKKWAGLNFGGIFLKRIWSPWLACTYVSQAVVALQKSDGKITEIQKIPDLLAGPGKNYTCTYFEVLSKTSVGKILYIFEDKKLCLTNRAWDTTSSTITCQIEVTFVFFFFCGTLELRNRFDSLQWVWKMRHIDVLWQCQNACTIKNQTLFLKITANSFFKKWPKSPKMLVFSIDPRFLCMLC